VRRQKRVARRIPPRLWRALVWNDAPVASRPGASFSRSLSVCCRFASLRVGNRIFIDCAAEGGRAGWLAGGWAGGAPCPQRARQFTYGQLFMQIATLNVLRHAAVTARRRKFQFFLNSALLFFGQRKQEGDVESYVPCCRTYYAYETISCFCLLICRLHHNAGGKETYFQTLKQAKCFHYIVRIMIFKLLVAKYLY
jgi:hypothetical protein